MERRVREEEVLPDWYGMAYFDWTDRRIVAYPIGLHWVMGWWRIVKWHIKFPPWRHYTTGREFKWRRERGLY